MNWFLRSDKHTRGKGIFKKAIAFIGLVYAIYQAANVILYYRSPALVYDVTAVQFPLNLDNKEFSYYGQIYRFQNEGKTVAHKLRVEVSMPTPVGNPVPPPTRQISNGAIIMKTRKGIIFRMDETENISWGGAFDSDHLETANSVADYRQKITIGNGIVRTKDKNIIMAYKDLFFPGQEGFIVFRGFIPISQNPNIVFESEEIQGKNKTTIKSYEPLLSEIKIGLLAFVVFLTNVK